MTYEIHRLPRGTRPLKLTGEFSPEALPAPYADLPEAEIAVYPWKDAHPASFPAYARVGWNEDGLIVLMYAEEAPVLARVTEVGALVCEDSCLEFFLMPFPEKDACYVNIEVNPLATPHVGLGESRHNRRVYRERIEGMDVSASAPGRYWAVSYLVPAAFLEKEFGASLAPGHVMRGNFYKCSEDIHPHFGVWNPVVSPKADFHRPECFGEMILK